MQLRPSVIPRGRSHRTLSTLNVIHHTALRLATGTFRTTRVVSLHYETRQFSLPLHLSLVLLEFVLRFRQIPKTLNVNPSTSNSSKAQVNQVFHCRTNQTFSNLDLPSHSPIRQDIYTPSSPWKSNIINFLLLK